MKKTTLRNFGIALVTSLSLLSYAYLNCCAAPSHLPSQSLNQEVVEMEEEIEESDSKIALPDAKLVKDVIDLMRRLATHS